MKFDSLTHALHYAAGTKTEILFYKNKVIDVSEFKHSHPGNINILYVLMIKKNL